MEVKTIRKFLKISLIKSIYFLWRWSLPATGRWRRPWPPTRRSCENWGHWSSTTTPRVAGAGSWSWWPAASTSSSSAPRRSSPPSSSASANPAQSPGNYSPNSLGRQVGGEGRCQWKKNILWLENNFFSLRPKVFLVTVVLFLFMLEGMKREERKVTN